MSSLVPPSLVAFDPKYVNSSTSPSCCPSILIGWFNILAFIRIVFVFGMLIFSPVLFWMLLNLLDMTAISSAKSRSSNYLVNFHLIPVFLSCTLFFMNQSRIKGNGNPNSPQPCFLPCSLSSPNLTVACHSHIVTIFGGTPYDSMIFNRVS